MHIIKLLQKMTVIAILQLLFTGCSTPTLVLPTVTPLPPTETPIPPTDTPTPPTATPEPTETPIPPTPTKVPSFTDMVDVGGYKLYLRCIGEGSPTVVLESDIAKYINVWNHVLSENPTDMGIQVCVYNRSGLGSSQGSSSEIAPNKPRTSQDMAEDLYHLLTNAHIDGPYVLVGYFMGAWNTRLFTDLYPEDVAGMILIDGGHPDYFTRVLDLLPPEAEGENATITAIRNYYTRLLEEPLKNAEYWDIKNSAIQLHAVSPIGDLPLVVLSHDVIHRSALYESYWKRYYLCYGDDFPFELYNKMEDAWTLQMDEMAALSSNSTYIMVEDSTYLLLSLQPESVVDAIRIVLEAVRAE